jgi:hypothetical protein
MSKTKDNGPQRPRSAQVWSRVVDDWHRSRQIASDFCLTRGLSLKTFQWWRWALATYGGRPPYQTGAPPSDSPGRSAVGAAKTLHQVPAFIEVVQRPTAPSVVPHHHQRASGVEVVLLGKHGERRIQIDAGFDATTLRQVVSVLEEV